MKYFLLDLITLKISVSSTRDFFHILKPFKPPPPKKNKNKTQQQWNSPIIALSAHKTQDFLLNHNI